MAYTAAVLDSQIDVSNIRDLLVQGDTAFPTINFTLPAGFTGLTWRVRGTFMQFNLATQSEELTATGSTTISIAWPVGSNFTTYYGEMQIVLVGTDALGNIVTKATGYVNVQRDFSISTVEIVDENLFEQLMAELSSSAVMLDQTDEQEMTGGVLKLAADRVISDDHHIVDKKHVADAVATVTADDFNHNDLANKQGGTTNEYYHVTAAEKTIIENTSGTNTGDQDVSGAISAHNTDAGAHANLQILDAGGYYDATTVEGALQAVGALVYTAIKGDFMIAELSATGKYLSAAGVISTIGNAAFVLSQYPVIANRTYVLYGVGVGYGGNYPIAGFKTGSGMSGTCTVLVNGVSGFHDYNTTYTPTSNGYIFIASHTGYSIALKCYVAVKGSEYVTDAINYVSQFYEKKVLIIGDSLVAANKWQTEVVKLHKCVCVNRALGGYGLVMMLDGGSNGVSTLAALAIADVAGVSLIIISGGVNDHAALKGALTDLYPAQNTIAGKLQYLINGIYAVLATAGNLSCKILVVAPHCYGTNGDSHLIDAYSEDPVGSGETFKDKADIICAVAKNNNLPSLNLWEESGYGVNTWPIYGSSSVDKLHFNDAGYARVGRIIAEKMNRI